MKSLKKSDLENMSLQELKDFKKKLYVENKYKIERMCKVIKYLNSNEFYITRSYNKIYDCATYVITYKKTTVFSTEDQKFTPGSWFQKLKALYEQEKTLQEINVRKQLIKDLVFKD